MILHGEPPLADLIEMVEKGGPDAVENAMEGIRGHVEQLRLTSAERSSVESLVRRVIEETDMRHIRQWTGIMLEAVLICRSLLIKLSADEISKLRARLEGCTSPTDWAVFRAEDVLGQLDLYLEQTLSAEH